jgi:GNAT superfamily N-acetyltransferase
MAIVWLMTAAIVAIGGFCAGLGFHAMSKFGGEAVFVFLRYTLGNRMRYQPRKRTSLFVRALTPSELPNYVEHLLRLDSADRRMRFGFPIGDTGMRALVQRIDLRTGHILALFDDIDVVAAAHIGRASDDVAELALSVDREWRGRGVGSELFARAVLWARNRGIRQAIVYCLSENQAMRHIVRKAGGQMTVAAGEIEGQLELLPGTPLSLLVEEAFERSAWLGLFLKLVTGAGFHEPCGDPVRPEGACRAHSVRIAPWAIEGQTNRSGTFSRWKET